MVTYKTKPKHDDQLMDSWRNSLVDLFNHISNYLSEYSPDISIDKTFRTAYGKDGKRRRFIVPVVKILDRPIMRFEPVLSSILGYKGRVDVIIDGFTKDRIQLFLERSHNEDHWLLRINNRDEGNFSDETLEKLISDVIDSKT